MARVLICDPVAADCIQAIKAAGHEVVEQTGMSHGELVAAAPTFDALVIRSATRPNREVLTAGVAGQLKLVVRGGVGLDNVDLEAAKELGVQVNNTPSASSVAVAELTFAHMLAASRFVAIADRTIKAGEWNKKAYGAGKELFGSTLGLIGFGRIAQEVAKRAIAFGMEVTFYDPFVDGHDLTGFGVRKVTLDALCDGSDYISLHVPFNEHTRDLLGEAQFARMKRGAVVVNCGRGGTMNEPALLAALESGTVAFAGTDVFTEEPARDNALAQHPHVTATPHIGAGTVGAKGRVGTEVASIIVDFFS